LIALPQVPIYLNQEENADLLKLCASEGNCSRYALAKRLILDAIKSFKEEKPIERGENDSGTEERRPRVAAISY